MNYRPGVVGDLGAREESVEIMRQLLAGDALPPDHRVRVEKNLALVLDLMKS